MLNNSLRLLIASILLMAGLAGSAAAAIVEFNGATVKYVFDTGSDTLDGYLDLFAHAEVLPGTDTLRFTPDGWTAEATWPSPAVDSANDTLTFSVVSLSDDTVINSVSLFGGGDYYKVGGYVGVGGELRVNATDIASITAGDFSTILPPGDPLVTTPWEEHANLGGYSDSALTITVENLLTARIVTLADDGSVVYDGIHTLVEKKFLDISVGTSVVPVPAAVWLMLSALGVLGAAGRRTARRV